MLKANSRNMPIGEIKIYSSFAESEPARKKVEARKAFYNVTGRFDKAVLIDGNNYLFDGYSSYIAAREIGMDRLSVLQVVNVKKKKPVVDKQEGTPALKVGDRVTASDNVQLYTNEVGTIEFVEPSDSLQKYYVKFDKGHTLWCYTDSVKPYTEPKYYNGKVVCTESANNDFTVGKVYSWVNGVVKDNDGFLRPCYGNKKITSLDDSCMKNWSYKFIPFKGE